MNQGGSSRTLHFPPRFNYSLESLKEYDSAKHDFLILILESLAKSELGLDPRLMSQFKEYANYIMKTGLIMPRFDEDNESMYIYFQIWSLFRNQYVEPSDLEDGEAMMVEYILERIFHVN